MKHLSNVFYFSFHFPVLVTDCKMRSYGILLVCLFRQIIYILVMSQYQVPTLKEDDIVLEYIVSRMCLSAAISDVEKKY